LSRGAAAIALSDGSGFGSVVLVALGVALAFADFAPSATGLVLSPSSLRQLSEMQVEGKHQCTAGKQSLRRESSRSRASAARPWLTNLTNRVVEATFGGERQ